MQTLISKAREANTETLIEAVTVIGGGNVTVEARMARAALIEVLTEREGAEFAEKLMDEIGL